ncbi:MAG TPA: SSI family serine proteinase inhibitor [Micromonosporaceae bacterium]|nr:SSI family serine proteinase inhibitor [Micromonosporaceae bacterium]
MIRSNRYPTLRSTLLRQAASVALAASTAAGIALAPAPASAAPAPTTRLVLTVAKGESPRPAQSRTLLTCNPAGGTHPNPAAACAALAAANGNPAKLTPAGIMCTMQYEPVTVTIVGQYRNRPVRYRHTFGNPCAMRDSVGSVVAS